MGTAADEKHADADEFDPPANFTDTYYFPPFSQLQSEYHVGQDLYEDGETWCLLAEIDAASTSAGNPFCLVCHDRSGDSFIVGFDLSKGMRFSPAEFRIGYTVAVVYAKRVSFVDGTKGIRVSDMATCHAFPYKLDRLIELIHSCGAMTGEMDLFAIHACHQLQQTWSARMGKMTLRVDDLDPNVSGGTMRTMLSFASGGSKAMAAAGRPSLLTPVPYTKPLETVRGIHRHPVLGLLTLSSPPSDQARTLINRSWGLLGGPESSWGPNFQYNEYERAHSYLGAILNLVRCYLILAMFSCVQYAWFREFLTRCAPDLGVGPSEEQIRSLPFTAAAFVEADPAEKENRGKGCLVKLRYTEGNYPFAAMLMAQAAATLLNDRNLSAGIKGGCLTAGVLGADFVERARQGGLEIETTMLEGFEA
ncbi:hypothetical protein C8035_v009170 [Colletotrichum spinosum]|uniref:Trans-acting enoyl reductase n=1 Tax=Colletotrichum spinosum TaxID=1347390 RepID=A0A4R8QAE7_9PEZI|nr:hypothetical protein C8035_v009170 [Colletotrichum spinosum]